MSNFFVHESAFVDEGAIIGENCKVWHFCHIMKHVAIGANCSFGQNVMVYEGVKIGSGVKVQNNVSIFAGVTIDDDVFIGPSVVFTNVKTPRSFINRSDQFLETKILKGASLGANVTVICGNQIGQYAMVGAGAVITKNVAPFALVIGNPAKQIGWVSEFGCRLIFNDNGRAVCNESLDQYQLNDGSVYKVNGYE